MADPPRRFPAPWRADRTPHGYVVRDATGPTDEARRIAANIRTPAGAPREG
jgi:hypothetical protein